MKVSMDKLTKVLTPSQKRDSLQKVNTAAPRSKKKRVKGPKEEQIQGQVEAYLRLKGIQFLRIPDSVYRMCSPMSSLPIWQKKEISQYLRGVPDLLIFKKEMLSDEVPCVDNSCLMLELKRKGGKAGQAQKQWHRGLMVHVPESFEEAKTLIERWA